MIISIDIITFHRQELLKDINSKVKLLNSLSEKIKLIEGDLDKDMRELININERLQFLDSYDGH